MRPSKSRLTITLLFAGTIVAGLTGWRFFQRNTRVHGIRNVVLISIDTCRADHLSCYGYNRPTTPHIDAVAREGVLFEKALSPVPLTTPAHSAMLTGTYPPTNGVRLNNGDALADSNVTLAEVLRQAGYKTGAFVSGFPLDPRFGLNQGFETYDCQYTRKSETSSTHSERTAEDVSLPALAWLEANAGAPFFLFLHYYDPHFPYEPPPPYAESFAQDPYSGEIAYVDHWIGQVVDRLRKLGAYDDTLLIITADHGESLGQHGETSHGFFIYQTTQHVPLIIRAPHVRKDSRIEGRVGLVDLVPTVLDILALKSPLLVEGTSLRRDLEGDSRPDQSRIEYCESLAPTQFDCSALHALVDGAWKYIRSPREELYDLSKDPGETNNVFDRHPQEALRLRERLDEELKEMEAAAPDRDAKIPDPDAVRRLQSLGYVGGGATPTTSEFNPKLEDPKDFIATFERLGKANFLFHSNRGQEAEHELLEIVGTRPRLIGAQQQLAEIALHQHRPADAVSRYAKVLSLMSESGMTTKRHASPNEDLASAHFNLAFALREAGREGEAIENYEKAIILSPDFVDAHNSLGLVLARQGKYKEAIAHYEAALRIKPDQASVHNNLGNALRNIGKLEDAIGQYEEALRLQPNTVSALTNLAMIRAADGDPRSRNGPEAVQLAERACAVTGRSVGCLDTLAAAYAEAQRFGDAVAAAEAAVALAESSGQTAIADEIRGRLAGYRERRPYRVVLAPPSLR